MNKTIQNNKNMRDLDFFFNPRSVAVVGVPRGMKAGRLFFDALIDIGFQGPLYPINPNAEEINGYKAYPDITSIDGPVDLAIVLVPTHQVEDVLRQCARKKTKAVVLYTAGYRELGTEEGRHLEERLLTLARQGGIRILGPNCMGVYNPSGGLSFFPALPRTSGKFGFISQSGSLANMLCRSAPQSSVFFSKAISIGNELDLTCTDFLEYLGGDEETACIGIYIEGLKDGQSFLSVLRQVCMKKPVLIWKAGFTDEGTRAVVSHTGSMTGSNAIWRAAFQQTGAIEARGIEDMFDAMIAFYFLSEDLGDRVAIISGPGGLAVAAADACGHYGLKLASLQPKTQKRLSTFVPNRGTSIKNPIDVSLSASLDVDLYGASAREVLADPSVDAVFVIGIGMSSGLNTRYVRLLIDVKKDLGKPIVCVAIPGFPSEFSKELFKSGIPIFSSPERAIQAYSKVWRYQQFRKAVPARY